MAKKSSSGSTKKTGNPAPRTTDDGGLPSEKQILEFLNTAQGKAGKREIARAFGLKGQEKIALKALLKDMADEGLIDGKRTAYHRMGGVPKVTVLRVVEIEDGEAIAVPDSWAPDDATVPPRIRLREKGRGSALRSGDRVLARTEETGSGWIAHPMKKLPTRADQVMGVVEIDRSGKGWLAPVDKRERHSQMIADLGGAEEGQLVLAEPIGRSPRSGVKVTAVETIVELRYQMGRFELTMSKMYPSSVGFSGSGLMLRTVSSSGLRLVTIAQ